MNEGESGDWLTLGAEVDGETLVCHGDDLPDEFVSWLDTLAHQFLYLQEKAEELGVDLVAAKSKSTLFDIVDFCEEIGIDIGSRFWEGDHISGNFKIGWLASSEEKGTALKGKQLIAQLEAGLTASARKQIIADLRDIDDLEELLERTKNFDFGVSGKLELSKQLLSAKTEQVAQLENKIDQLNQSIFDFTNGREAGAAEINRACIDLAAAVIEGRNERIVAGPLVLWDDGVVYAMIARGSFKLPSDSPPARLIEALDRSGRAVVKVQETTIIGGWTSGPIYVKGDPHIGGWHDVWSTILEKERKFAIKPESAEGQVYKILSALAGEVV